MSPSTVQQTRLEKTIDVHALARMLEGDRVEVEARRLHETTEELFQKTLELVRPAGETPRAPRPERREPAGERYVPENEDLRRIYLFAEALGGYGPLHDLINAHSPGQSLSREFSERADKRVLTESELRTLEEYQHQIHEALRNAHRYLHENSMEEFALEEIHELFELLTTASRRARDLNRIIGIHLIREIEQTVRRLYEFREMIHSVHRTVDGIFLVNSEVMFVPTTELIACVETIFRGVGNPYFAQHIDGVLLLAARNLLIEVASFHSYYGKQQIYNLIHRAGSTVSTNLITHRIRHEVHKLFAACQRENKLVLRRVMQNAEREFEMSVQAIEDEAIRAAVEEVKVFIPQEVPELPPPRPGLLRRILGWLRL